MTATATAPNIDQIAPGVATRVRDGDLRGKQRMLLAAGLVALALSCIGLFTDSAQFLFSYAVAYMFTLSIALGALFFVMLQHVTRAGWSVVVRRIAENMMGTMPIMAVLFVPIALGYHTLFHHWVDADLDPASPAYDALVAHKSAYLNVPFFFVRVVIYFGAWIALARFFRSSSLSQDLSGDPGVSLKMSRRAAPGILIFAMTVTFAAFDWIMSMDPHWFSTIFGVTYFAGGVMAVLGTLTLVCLWLGRSGYLKDLVTVEHYHDLGKLMFAFMVFWAYVSFSQYMLIWYANLPEETMWYQHRSHGSWGAIGSVLVFGHFLVPFAFLMSRHVKRSKLLLSIAAVFLLVMHWFDMQFLIMPTEHPEGIAPSWLDLTTMVGVFAVFLAATLASTIRAPLIPERDPRLRESVRFENV